jgi:hypothetical protein
MNIMLYSIPERRILRADWPQRDAPVSPGSIVKPFTALAYAQANHYFYPDHFCRGAADRCWWGRGHQKIGIRDAVAHSCNHYFRELARALPPNATPALLAQFGVEVPEGSPDTQIGLGSDWKVRPEALAGAFAELLSRPADPGIFPLIDGMRRAARYGTARALGPGYLAKTGTGPNAKLDGDGYAIIAYPEAAPRELVLLQAPGVTGAKAVEMFTR